jgi:hypothetical protein
MSEQHTNLPIIILGKTLTKVQRIEGKYDEGISDQILFFCDDGTVYKMYHDQDCCEGVHIEVANGDPNFLIGSPICIANEYTHKADDGEDWETTYTFYRFGTVKGYVDIRWVGSSNGYYSTEVDFEDVTEEYNKKDEEPEYMKHDLPPVQIPDHIKEKILSENSDIKPEDLEFDKSDNRCSLCGRKFDQFNDVIFIFERFKGKDNVKVHVEVARLDIPEEISVSDINASLITNKYIREKNILLDMNKEIIVCSWKFQEEYIRKVIGDNEEFFKEVFTKIIESVEDGNAFNKCGPYCSKCKTTRIL